MFADVLHLQNVVTRCRLLRFFYKSGGALIDAGEAICAMR